MAVAVELEFDGGTLGQYDEVAKLMNYEPGGFEQYAHEKIGAYTQRVGIPGPPRIMFYDVHNYQALSVPTK